MGSGPAHFPVGDVVQRSAIIQENQKLRDCRQWRVNLLLPRAGLPRAGLPRAENLQPASHHTHTSPPQPFPCSQIAVLSLLAPQSEGTGGPITRPAVPESLAALRASHSLIQGSFVVLISWNSWAETSNAPVMVKKRTSLLGCAQSLPSLEPCYCTHDGPVSHSRLCGEVAVCWQWCPRHPPLTGAEGCFTYCALWTVKLSAVGTLGCTVLHLSLPNYTLLLPISTGRNACGLHSKLSLRMPHGLYRMTQAQLN